jgi:hypothetical protein
MSKELRFGFLESTEHGTRQEFGYIKNLKLLVVVREE